MDYRLVVFDIAGTTVRDDGLVAEALVGALADDGCTIAPQAAQALMGYAKPYAIEQLIKGAGHEAGEKRVARVHAAFIERMLKTYKTDSRVVPMADAEHVFETLHADGVVVALNTAFTHDIAEAIVERMGWRERGLIDEVISADQVREGRPAPHMIRTLMSRAGVDDARFVAKVGDTEVDVREGRNAGCGLVVAVTTGAYTREALEEYRPDHIVDALGDVLPLLRANAASLTA